MRLSRARAAARSRRRTAPSARRRAKIVAFSDANATWEPDALRKLVRGFADPDVAYVCGRLRAEAADGSNREGRYWRYELWLRESESRLGSVTGGNGSIYALRREDYVEVDPRFGHDLAFPYLMVQRGRRAVFEPEAVAYEKPTPDQRDRVPAEGADVRALLADRAARRGCCAACRRAISLRSSRTGCCATGAASSTRCCSARTLALVGAGRRLRRRARRPAFVLLAAAGAGLPIARYYALVTLATLTALAATTSAAASRRRGRRRRGHVEHGHGSNRGYPCIASLDILLR